MGGPAPIANYSVNLAALQEKQVVGSGYVKADCLLSQFRIITFRPVVDREVTLTFLAAVALIAALVVQPCFYHWTCLAAVGALRFGLYPLFLLFLCLSLCFHICILLLYLSYFTVHFAAPFAHQP